MTTRRKAATETPTPSPEANEEVLLPGNSTSQLTTWELLAAVQERLNVPKNRENKFGGFKYRSAEDILAAAKDLCVQWGLLLTVSDTVTYLEGRWYIVATATVTNVATGHQISATGYAREPETKKGMDDSQLTGATSSYARKYALNGLFAIDDTKDADSEEFTIQQEPRQAPTATIVPASTTNGTARKDARTAAMNRLHALKSHDEAKAMAKREFNVDSMTHLSLPDIQHLISIAEGREQLPDELAYPEETLIAYADNGHEVNPANGPDNFTELWKLLRTQGVKDRPALEAMIGPIGDLDASQVYQKYRAHLLAQ